MLLILSNKDELKIAVDILKRKNLDIDIFQTPVEFKGINLYAIQCPSASVGNSHEALRGHGIKIGGIYIYDSLKLQRLGEGPNILTKWNATSQIHLKSINIIKVLPCLVEADMIRITAETSTDIAEIMPYLNALMPKATYNEETKTITFTEDRRVITIYPSKIEMGKVKGISDAISVLSWVRDMVNKTYENRDSIEPSTKRKVKINALELYRYLPKTNCRECGELTCLAFAVKVLMEEQKIINCSPLQQPEFSENRDFIFRILGAMGYSLPRE